MIPANSGNDRSVALSFDPDSTGIMSFFFRVLIFPEIFPWMSWEWACAVFARLAFVCGPVFAPSYILVLSLTAVGIICCLARDRKLEFPLSSDSADEEGGEFGML